MVRKKLSNVSYLSKMRDKKTPSKDREIRRVDIGDETFYVQDMKIRLPTSPLRER